MLDVEMRAQGWALFRTRANLALSLSDPKVVTALAVLRQKRRAAEVLSHGDCPAEALRMAGEALAAIEPLTASVQSLVTENQGAEAVLGACGVPAAVVTRFIALRSERALPDLDATFDEQDLDQLEATLQVCRSVESVFADLSRSQTQRARQRVVTVVVPLGVILLIAAQLWLAGIELERWPTANASSTFHNMFAVFGPGNAVDRRPETEWVPVDNSPGWLELTWLRRRDVHAVALRNGRNPPFNDRAVRDYRIELYRGKRLLAQASGRFPAIEPAPATIFAEIHAQRVDRVRIVVDSFHGLGPALSEVEIR